VRRWRRWPAPSVLIVDDHAGFRANARALLEASGFRVLGEAASGEDALIEVERLRPDVVLLDVQLPGLDGFAVAARLAERGGAPAVVLVSSRGEHSLRRRLAASPARGFIPKGELTAECLNAALA
jgi:DNA-binding NarL/FixJ family response regulator